jgi:hypothetical protein
MRTYTYQYACLSAYWIAELDGHHTVWFFLEKVQFLQLLGSGRRITYIVKDNVCDFSQRRAFISNVFFEIKEERCIIFQLLQCEHVF